VQREFAHIDSPARFPARRPLAELVQRDMAQRLYLAMVTIEALDRFSEHHQIRGMLLNETETAGWMAPALWAERANVPRFLLNHGVTLGSAYTVVRRMDAEFVLSFGPRGGEPYIDAGFDPSAIVSVGNPAWDHYPAEIANRAALRARLEREQGFVPGAPVITLTTVWTHRLTSLLPDWIVPELTRTFLAAIARLQRDGMQMNVIVKGRPSNGPEEMENVAKIAAESGGATYSFVTGDLAPIAAISDVMISAESSTIIESMMCGAIGVNVRSNMSWLLGPGYSAQDGLLEVQFGDDEGLARELRGILTDPARAAQIKQTQANRIPLYIGALDGRSAERAAEFVAPRLLAPVVKNPASSAAWRHLGEDGAAAPGIEFPRVDIASLIGTDARNIIVMGGGIGATSAEIKKRLPQASVRQILSGPGEADLSQVGITDGSIDTIVLIAALERMLNPWQFLQQLRRFLTPEARVYAAVPNVRNLWLLNDMLMGGKWEHGTDGTILDIRNVRFFSATSLRAMFDETGYDVLRFTGVPDRRGQGLQIPARGTAVDIDAPRVTLRQVTTEDVGELKSAEFIVTARPRG
jgi:hypothetical protein